jgi:hypothetical protein
MSISAHGERRRPSRQEYGGSFFEVHKRLPHDTEPYVGHPLCAYSDVVIHEYGNSDGNPGDAAKYGFVFVWDILVNAVSMDVSQLGQVILLLLRTPTYPCTKLLFSR